MIFAALVWALGLTAIIAVAFWADQETQVPFVVILSGCIIASAALGQIVAHYL